MKKNPSWTPEEDQLLVAHRTQGKAFKEIAAFIQRAPHAISARWRYIRLTTEKRRDERKAKGSPKTNLPIFQIEQRVSIPDHVLEERERRSMVPRSLTAILLGDPEPNRVRL